MPKNTPNARPGRVEWIHVLGALGEDQTRSTAWAYLACSLKRLDNSTTQPKPLASRLGPQGLPAPDPSVVQRAADTWTHRATREAVCNALTFVEDWLEYQHPGRRAERTKLRAVRRRLEEELWP